MGQPPNSNSRGRARSRSERNQVLGQWLAVRQPWLVWVIAFEMSLHCASTRYSEAAIILIAPTNPLKFERLVAIRTLELVRE